MRSIIFFIVFISGWLFLPCHAQETLTEMSSDQYHLYYRRDRIDIDKDYLDNSTQFERIRKILSQATRIDSITIYAYASPEGGPQRNAWLAQKRTEAARDFIVANLSADSVLLTKNIRLQPLGENWKGLEEELEANYHLMNRDRVMRIIHANVPTETKKWRLKQLDNGYTYNWIIRHHMPKLRFATWICIYRALPEIEHMEPVMIMLEEKMAEEQAMIPLMKPVIIEPVQTARKTIVAIKTNMLYDALSLLNYSVEVPIGKHISLLGYHQFPWWTWGEAKNQYCIRFLSVGAEGRWWFNSTLNANRKDKRKRDKLTGHFLGIYGESGKWDFQWERSICHQGEHWSAGLSYGYAMPVNKFVNIEFSISAGYASIPYRKYVPSENYEILWSQPAERGRWHYFGPTKAQVSLVIPITVKTTKKGGMR